MGAAINIENYIGTTSGRLTIIGEGEPLFFFNKKRNLNCKSKTFKCKCECGNITDVLMSNFKSGQSKSCGCLGKEVKGKARLTHGLSGEGGKRAKEYGVWATMLQRCNNPKADNYRFYGGKGVSVCERWHSFENFISDMGKRPSDDHSIDRIDSTGNYEPSNCRWANKITQANNTQRNNPLEYDGAVLNSRQWSEVTGINASTIKNRLKNNWTTENALTIPARKITT